MRGGRLRHQVSVEQKSDTYLSTGEPTQSWTTFIASARAEIRQTGGTETRRGDQTEASTACRVAMRYADASEITAGMRVKTGTRTLDIVSAADPDGRGERIELACQEVG